MPPNKRCCYKDCENASEHSHRDDMKGITVSPFSESELDEPQRTNCKDCHESETVESDQVGSRTNPEDSNRSETVTAEQIQINPEDSNRSETVTAEQLEFNPKDFDAPESFKVETYGTYPEDVDVSDTLVDQKEDGYSQKSTSDLESVESFQETENQVNIHSENCLEASLVNANNSMTVLSPLFQTNESAQVENNFIDLKDVFNKFHEFQVSNMASSESWVISRNASVDSLCFYNTKKMREIGVLSVQMNKDLQVLIEVFGRTLPDNHILLLDESFPNTLKNMKDLLFFFAYVDTFEICIGNKDKRFEEFSGDKSHFFNRYTNATHSNNCQGLLKGSERCGSCVSLAINIQERFTILQKTNSQSLLDNNQSQLVTINNSDGDKDQYGSLESADTEIELGVSSKKRQRRSKIWDYFNIATDGYCTCKLCHNRINSTSGNTTSMRRHIRAKHIGENIQLESGEKEGQLKNAQETLFPSDHSKAIKITNSIGRMIALDFQPYSIVENQGFKQVIQECEPRYQLPSQTTFSASIIPNLYNQIKEEIKNDITEAFKEEIMQSFSLTTDFWKSKSNDCFLEVTCHFTTKNFEPKIYNIACLPFFESHNVDDVKKALEELVASILPEERRERIPIYQITDKVPNITKMINILDWTRMPCFCHTLQLAIYDSFEQLRLGNTSVTKILTKARVIVEYFKTNAHAGKLLCDSQVNLLGISENDTKQLISDVITRWNSEYYVLLRLYELRQPIMHALREIQNIDNLFKMEWDIVKTLLDILEPFAIASKDHFEVEVSGVFLRNLLSRFPNYRREPLYLLSTILDPNEDPDCNVFDYWKLRALDFPHLAKLAKKFLIIPATLTSSERLFSFDANAIEKRSLLLTEHVEQLTMPDVPPSLYRVVRKGEASQ